MLKFSLLVPTRARKKSLNRYLRSVKATVMHPEEIEILILCDDDDQETIKALENIETKYKPLNVSCYKRPRSEWNNEDYYNYLAKKAKGKYIWANADDLVFEVQNWDLILWLKLNYFLSDKPDRIVCANILDNTPAPGDPPGDKSKFPCFPLFSREVLGLLGFILPPQLPTWGADKYVYELFTKAERFCIINDTIYLNHVSYHQDYKNIEADELTTRAGDICAKYAVLPKHMPHKKGPTIDNQAEIIRKEIENARMG